MANSIHFPINHNNAPRMEFFINKVTDELRQIDFDWKSWKKTKHITDAFKYISVNAKDPLTITIFFCDSYSEANDIGMANALPDSKVSNWGVNGDLLFIIECNDTIKLNDVLSLFSGEE